GGTWQQRWQSSGAEAAAATWQQLPAQPAHCGRTHAGAASGELAPALLTAIGADIVRPSLAWLAAGGCRHAELARAMAISRDPGGFAQLQELCDSDPAVTRPVCNHTPRRAA